MSGKTDLAAAYLRALPNGYKHEGVTFPGALISKERLLAMKDQKFGPNDVIVASFPKTGTTLVNEIVSCVLHDGNLDIVKRTQNHERVPCIEFDVSSFWVQSEEATASVQCFFTHVPWQFLPSQAQAGGCKIIHVARNPKDTAVSFFHFHSMAVPFGKQTWSWDEFLSYFMAGEVSYGDWFDYHLKYYKECKDKKHVLFLKYEDLIKNFDNELERICTFVDKKLSVEAKGRIKEHCKFSSMQNNPMANREGVIFFDQEISKFVRKGIVGDWKNHFALEQNEIFDKLYEEKIAGSGLEFDFE